MTWKLSPYVPFLLCVLARASLRRDQKNITRAPVNTPTSTPTQTATATATETITETPNAVVGKKLYTFDALWDSKSGNNESLKRSRGYRR